MSEIHNLDEKMLAERLEGLGYTLRLSGKYREAELLYLKCLKIKERLYPDGGPVLANCINSKFFIIFSVQTITR